MNARAVAQIALIDAQTASVIGEDQAALLTLLSALNYIASNGMMYRNRWDRYRRIVSDWLAEWEGSKDETRS